MIITITERGVFKRCRAQWDYSSFNRQGLQMYIPRPPLGLGGLVHKAHEFWVLSYYGEDGPCYADGCNTPLSQHHLVDHFMHKANEGIDGIKATYRENVGTDMNDNELNSYYEFVYLGRDMMTNYEKKWRAPLPEGFTFVQPEQTVVIPIPGTEHNCTSLNCKPGHCSIINPEGPIGKHMIEGTLDGLIANDRGWLFVLERKTFDKRPNDKVLRSSDQFLGYLYLLKKLELGMIGGIAYDGMWKRAQPPRGRVFDDLFLRHTLQRPPEEIDKFEHYLALEANDMANNPSIYLNRRWEGCYDCDFEELCMSEARGEDANILRKNKFMKRPTQDRSYADLEQAAV